MLSHNQQTDTVDFLIDIEGVNVGHTADVVDNGHEAGLKIRIVDVEGDSICPLASVYREGWKSEKGHGQ